MRFASLVLIAPLACAGRWSLADQAYQLNSEHGSRASADRQASYRRVKQAKDPEAQLAREKKRLAAGGGVGTGGAAPAVRHKLGEEIPGSQVHILFSTSCSAYQHWQSLLLTHSAQWVGQQGKITRLVAGCSGAKEMAAARASTLPPAEVYFHRDFSDFHFVDDRRNKAGTFPKRAPPIHTIVP